jgi:filamentous hemagglutinin
MEEVMANPMGSTPPGMPPMSDMKNNLLAADRWVKRTQRVNGVEIHYAENISTKQMVDFKFK